MECAWMWIPAHLIMVIPKQILYKMLDFLWLFSFGLVLLKAVWVAQLSRCAGCYKNVYEPSCRTACFLWRTRIHMINLMYSFAIQSCWLNTGKFFEHCWGSGSWELVRGSDSQKASRALFSDIEPELVYSLAPGCITVGRKRYSFIPFA